MIKLKRVEELITELKSIEDIKNNYQLVNTEEGIIDLVDKLLNVKEYCFDTETTSLNPLEAKLVGISFSIKKGEAFYVPIKDTTAKSTLEILKKLFSAENKVVIAHNFKYDYQVLKNNGIEIKGTAFDTMVAHYLLQPDLKHNMDYLAETYLNYKPISIETLIGKKGKNQGNMKDLKAEEVSDYACEDADITLQLKEIFEKQLKEIDLIELFQTIEMPLIKVLANMEREGINLDVKALHIFFKRIRRRPSKT